MRFPAMSSSAAAAASSARGRGAESARLRRSLLRIALLSSASLLLLLLLLGNGSLDLRRRSFSSSAGSSDSAIGAATEAGQSSSPSRRSEEVSQRFASSRTLKKSPSSSSSTTSESKKGEEEEEEEDAAAAEAEAAEAAARSGKPYSLGPKISDWDEQRRAWLQRNPDYPSYYANGRPRTMLVTGSQPTACQNPVGDHYLVKSLKNKIDYCRIHGIEVFYNMAHLDAAMSGFWAKLPLLRKIMLSHPEVEWIWWMDSDAMFTDMVFEVPMARYEAEGYNAVFHGWEEMVYAKKSWIGLNTGSFLIRNCQWALDLLDEWAPMGPKGKIRDDAGKLLTRALDGRPQFEADDQSAMIYLLITQRDRWGSKVKLESSYYLHGYWVILVDRYEEMLDKFHPGLGDDRWPFVTHFVGCKPCGKGTDYAAQRCIKQMERAFNFADDQILGIYGFQHRNLGSARVRRVRNDTVRPIDFEDDLGLLRRQRSAAIAGSSSI
jgi:xyloglucan 6-xylosyltransferase